MKRLFILSLVLFFSCNTPRYIYIVDDVYYSRPIERQTNTARSFYRRPSITPPLPFQYWYWQQYPNRTWQRVPDKSTGPRKENLDAYKSQLPPPPPPNKKEEVREEIKREAPIRKF
jgi:hypothetical protein